MKIRIQSLDRRRKKLCKSRTGRFGLETSVLEITGTWETPRGPTA